MSYLSPTFSGKVGISTPGPLFLTRFKDRVQTGLLSGKPHFRSRYIVTSHSDLELSFRASSLMTALNVGLNEVSLRLSGDGSVEYAVAYRRWAAYAVALSAVLGLVGVLAFISGAIERQIEQSPLVVDPILNRLMGLGFFWACVIFWGIIWPWILMVTHRPFARMLLNRIIREVDHQAAL